jgi:hypothetical protein
MVRTTRRIEAKLRADAGRGFAMSDDAGAGVMTIGVFGALTRSARQAKEERNCSDEIGM